MTAYVTPELMYYAPLHFDSSSMQDVDNYTKLLSEIADKGGFDDIEVMITNIESVVETSTFLADNGVMGLFAGLKRGSIAEVDAWPIIGPKNEEKKQVCLDELERNAIEGKFGQGKRRYWLACIRGKFPETSGSMIARVFLVMNLEKLLKEVFFALLLGVDSIGIILSFKALCMHYIRIKTFSGNPKYG